MVTSVIPLLSSSAAIPEQTMSLAFSPLWLTSLFVTALALSCGVLWLLANADRVSRRKDAVVAAIDAARSSRLSHGPTALGGRAG